MDLMRIGSKLEFLSFLKTNGCLDEFVREFGSRSGRDWRNREYPIGNGEYFACADPYDYFTFAFEWEGTEGGYMRWYNLASKWNDYLKEKRKLCW